MDQLKQVARRMVPKAARDGVRGGYWAARRWNERAPQQRALRHLVAEHGGVVRAGPFSGLRSLTTMDDGCIVPKLLGCYEEEIHPFVEAMIDLRPVRVIDVGCASGWYTTGFALRLPDAEVFGYDLDAGALARARALAEQNGVADRVTLRQEHLTPTTLGDLVDPAGTVIVVDIDGPEIDLLDPTVEPRLLGADVLVEFHDHFDATISGTIVGRFEATHVIRRIHALGRDPAHYPDLARFRTRWVREAAVAERRPVDPRQEFAAMIRSDRGAVATDERRDQTMPSAPAPALRAVGG